MKRILSLLTVLSLSLLGLLTPTVVANASLVCDQGECEYVFDRTDQPEVWQLPPGVTEVDFEVYGAQGGAGGGRGGFVSGTLINLPEELVVVVGGQGSRGAYSPGGFNGGGASGGKHANPGSGGGASDIRIGTEIEDRIVVAGGGGGYGGPVGGNGGHGGGEQAADGSAGQGGAGAGGTQLSGGAGGRSNESAIDGQNGGFGFGGAGGEDPIAAGGAGGGGGYYGGGGGGADTDICCLDAGGGGGGSSYADPNYTKNVTFQPGTKVGDGRIVFRYSQPPKVTELSYQQTKPGQAEVHINLDTDVIGVSEDDFVISGCTDKSLTGEGKTYTLTLDGCQMDATMEIPKNSFGTNSNVPQQNLLLELALDQQPPVASFTHPEIVNRQSFEIVVESDSEGIFDLSQLSSDDCQLESVVEQNVATITLSGCTEGEANVTFDRGFITDAIGNESFAESRVVSVVIDTTPPLISAGESEILELTNEKVPQIQSRTFINFTEPVVGFDDFLFTGDEACELSHELGEQFLVLHTVGCPEGPISWLLPASSVSDLVGNQAPETDLLIELDIPIIEVTVEPEPVAEQVQTPIESPGAESGSIPTPEPDAPVDETVSMVPEISETPEENLIVEPEPTQENDVSAEPAQTQTEITNDSSSEELSPAVDGTPESDSVSVNQDLNLERQVIDAESPMEEIMPISQFQNKGDTVESTVSPVAIGLASLLVTALIVGVIFLTKNNRSRTIE